MPVNPPPFPKLSSRLFESLATLPDEEHEANKAINNEKMSIRLVIIKSCVRFIEKWNR
jgi:hypothetical protein